MAALEATAEVTAPTAQSRKATSSGVSRSAIESPIASTVP